MQTEKTQKKCISNSHADQNMQKKCISNSHANQNMQKKCISNSYANLKNAGKIEYPVTYSIKKSCYNAIFLFVFTKLQYFKINVKPRYLERVLMFKKGPVAVRTGSFGHEKTHKNRFLLQFWA